MSPQIPILNIAIHFSSASLDLREKLFISTQQFSYFYERMKNIFSAQEYFLISTCNRTELFLFADSSTESPFESFKKLFQVHDLLQQNIIVRSGANSLKHLYEIASGVDSLVIGETQITGQFRECFEIAKKENALDSHLNFWIQEALRVSKQVRSQTNIGSKIVSVAHAGVFLAEKIYGDISRARVTIVGAGEMARQAFLYLQRKTPQKLKVLSRTLERAQNFSTELGILEFGDLSELEKSIRESDLIFTATASSTPLITTQLVEESDESKVFIDLSLPRNIEKEVAQCETIFLYDLDDIQKYVEENRSTRQLEIEQARGIIQNELSESILKYVEKYHSTEVQDYAKSLETLISQEIQKTLSKSSFKNITAAQIQDLDELQKSLLRKIIGRQRKVS